MKITKMMFTKKYKKQFLGLPIETQKKTLDKLKILKLKPFHPSLRLHKLRGNLDGSWSISINMSIRVIFHVLKDGTAILYSIGKHSIYENK